MPPSSETPRPRPVVLCVLGGFGERAEREGNAVRLARTPNLDALSDRPRTQLVASGPDVGLPAGTAGSGESGWITLGAGRVPELVRTRIDRAIDDEKLAGDEMLRRLFWLLGERRGARLHLFALVSDGTVHASMRHLHAVLEAAHLRNVEVVVHAILDGQDTSPKSAWRLLDPFLAYLDKKGTLGTVAGRHYALDRDGRWDLTHRYWKAVVKADGPRFDDAYQAIASAYDEGLGDAMVAPARLGDYAGVQGSFLADFASGAPRWDWWGEDVALAVTLRSDRVGQLAAMLRAKGLPPEALDLVTERGRVFHAFDEFSLTTLTEADPALELPVSFPPQPIADTLGEVVARAGLKQLRCGPPGARTHLGAYFGGFRPAPLDGEDRVFPAAAADAPDGGSAEVARAAAAAIEAGAHDLVVVSLPAADRAAHTGSLDAAVRAVEAVDAAIGVIARATLAAGGALVVTSDHGNCEDLIGADGPRPMHTTAPVPLVIVDDAHREAVLAPGRLADVAPTVLELLGLAPPAAMTGRSLLARR